MLRNASQCPHQLHRACRMRAQRVRSMMLPCPPAVPLAAPSFHCSPSSSPLACRPSCQPARTTRSARCIHRSRPRSRRASPSDKPLACSRMGRATCRHTPSARPVTCGRMVSRRQVGARSVRSARAAPVILRFPFPYRAVTVPLLGRCDKPERHQRPKRHHRAARWQRPAGKPAP